MPPVLLHDRPGPGQAQAAQSTLKKMMDQLKESNPSKDQLQKIMDEISKAIDPAQQYGKAGDYLKDATNEMKDGKILRLTEYWVEAGSEEPPEWRARWVERVEKPPTFYGAEQKE